MIFGGAEGIRTLDLLDAIEARSQLRHGPTDVLHFTISVVDVTFTPSRVVVEAAFRDGLFISPSALPNSPAVVRAAFCLPAVARSGPFPRPGCNRRATFEVLFIYNLSSQEPPFAKPSQFVKSCASFSPARLLVFRRNPRRAILRPSHPAALLRSRSQRSRRHQIPVRSAQSR